MRWQWYPVLGLGLIVYAVTTLSLTTTLENRSVSEWQGPERTWLDFLPWGASLVAGTIAIVLLALLLFRPATRGWVFPAGSIVGSGAVLATSFALATVPPGLFGHPFSIGELISLGLALAIAAYRAPTPWLLAAVAAAGGALLSDKLRGPYIEPNMDEVMSILFALTVTVAPGLYQRWRDRQRRDQLALARQEERLAIARDLHDVVAHQVTGIVVQVQALRHITRPDTTQPQTAALRDALPQIEDAASNALASMRQLVHALREPGHAPREPFDPQTQLADLRQRRRHDQPEVRVTLADDLGELPPDLGQAVLAIARESVTNALRHALGAREIEVAVWCADDAVHLRVVDDGWGSAPAPASTGGFGVSGMTERAHLLGGELDAAPAPNGRGWRVRATLPTTRVGAR